VSSHREAPEIAKDPVADNTDLYAFVSPDAPDKVTIIANFIPLQSPFGGPNFFEFGDDVRYAIHITNGGTANTDITYRFHFSTKIRNKNTFLYNTGPISSIKDPNWNRPQFYRVVRRLGKSNWKLLAQGLRVPPVNVGPRSTPDYEKFTPQAVHDIGDGVKVFAGQRTDAFFADLGSIFDLGTLRPFEHLHLIPSADAVGQNGLQGLNVHTIAIQVPKTHLTRGGKNPTDPMDANSVIGVWASAYRQRSRVFDHASGSFKGHGSLVQVSRLGNPLFNEVLVPMADKDEWNASLPHNDKEYAPRVLHPELGTLLPVLYPGVFPNLQAYTKPRADLAAILLTGIPAGVVNGFQNTTGPTQADLLRLNMAVPPTAKPNKFGLIGGDAAGFPNGRRLGDDIVAIELRAIAGVTIPLVDPGYTPDAAAAVLVDGTHNTNNKQLKHFPYIGNPRGGYQTTPAGEPTS
jgi:hypothetical protein